MGMEDEIKRKISAAREKAEHIAYAGKFNRDTAALARARPGVFPGLNPEEADAWAEKEETKVAEKMRRRAIEGALKGLDLTEEDFEWLIHRIKFWKEQKFKKAA